MKTASLALVARSATARRRLYQIPPSARRDASFVSMVEIPALSETIRTPRSFRKASAFSMPLPDRVYLIQSDIIRKLAAEGPCVIVGRCADYILRREKNRLAVFLHAPQSDRIRRAVDEYGDDLSTAADKLAKTDKKRSVYYSHYTGENWGAATNYDLVLDTSAFGVEGTVELIRRAAQLAAQPK